MIAGCLGTVGLGLRIVGILGVVLIGSSSLVSGYLSFTVALLIPQTLRTVSPVVSSKDPTETCRVYP